MKLKQMFFKVLQLWSDVPPGAAFLCGFSAGVLVAGQLVIGVLREAAKAVH